MPLPATMTGVEFDALPAEERRDWELIEGDLIEVPCGTPQHNLILVNLAVSLRAFARERRLGVVLPWTDLAVNQATRLRPDLAYFSRETWLGVDVNKVPVTATPDIAVEIISPSETGSMIERKVKQYLDWGVREVWLLDPETRAVYVHVRGGAQPTSALFPDFLVSVAEVFATDQPQVHLTQ